MSSSEADFAQLTFSSFSSTISSSSLTGRVFFDSRLSFSEELELGSDMVEIESAVSQQSNQ